MNELRQPLIRIFEAVLPDVLEHLSPSEFDIPEDALDIESLVDFLLAEPPDYRLGNGMLLTYFCDLTLPSTTDSQWRMGLTLLNQLARHLIKPTGRPTTFPERIFLCIFIEWCLDVRELGMSDAISEAKRVFGASESTLDRWYRSGKGVAAAERLTARAAMELFEQFRDLDEQAIADSLPDSLFEELNEASQGRKSSSD